MLSQCVFRVVETGYKVSEFQASVKYIESICWLFCGRMLYEVSGMHSSTVICVMLTCVVSFVEVLSDGKTTGTVSTLYTNGLVIRRAALRVKGYTRCSMRNKCKIINLQRKDNAFVA